MSSSDDFHANCVPRQSLLKLQRDLTHERSHFLHELCSLRNTVQSLQLQLVSAAASSPATSIQISPPNEPPTVASTVAPTPVQNSSNAFPVAKRQGSSSNLKLPESQYGTASNTATPTAVSVTSFGGASQPTVTTTPSSVLLPHVMEQTSVQFLSEALSSAAAIAELEELHAIELQQKDALIESMRRQNAEKIDEIEAASESVIRSLRHQQQLRQDTFTVEKVRHRQEAIAEVRDELRKEHATIQSLKDEVKRKSEEIVFLSGRVEERDHETRGLRLQMSQLQQQLVTYGVERTECRAALMSLSSEKLSLERRVKHLEAQLVHQARLVPNAPNGRKGADADTSRGSVGRSSVAFRRRSRISPELNDATAFQRHRRGSSPEKKDAALEGLLTFALDPKMARTISARVEKVRSEIAKRQEPPTGQT